MYHQPVLLREVLQYAQWHMESKPVVLDLTFGGGGHSRVLLGQLPPEGRLLAFDQDEDASHQASHITDHRFQFFRSNFRFFSQFLQALRIEQVDFILADLGVSSHQFDTPERGFSFRYPHQPLDMRMNRQLEQTAATVLNTYSPEQIQQVLWLYGEVPNAHTLAKAIAAQRIRKPFRLVADLNQLLEAYAPRQKNHQYFAKVYQALRIEINDEMGALRDMLRQAVAYLKPGGRIAIISYHSLEDRLVKYFFASGKFDTKEAPKDVYGNSLAPLQALHRKAIVPTTEEIEQNPRARSAKLRIAARRPT